MRGLGRGVGVSHLRLTADEYAALLKRKNRAGEVVQAKRVSPSGGSKIEEVLAHHMQIAGIEPPDRQFVPIEGRRFRADFAWPRLRLIVEVDGEVHRIAERFHADIEKHALLVLAGWTVLRVGGREVRDGTALKWVEAIHAKLAEVGR